MTAKKRITKIEVIKAGSNPDIDSDFNTEVRELAVAHVAELYGSDKVASIITFNKLAAKSAFKSMCTIYQIPFAHATKIASMVPGPSDGKDCTLQDIFDPTSPRYSEGADFRAATAGVEWKKVIEGALNVENRIKSTGVHPCGIVISSRPLTDAIPLTVRQEDGRVITQWEYGECEEMGLIKFDFLGLDTVDLIQHSVEYIRKNGKNPPNMVDLVHGPMDDPDTYELFSRGDTLGIFQFGSGMVQDFCKKMKPTEFEDLAATTALLRPGPMGMQSHIRYAARKNNLESVKSIHPDFEGSPLDSILGKTYSLTVYQEQIMKIANEVAGMSLQEGDELRKAMGKKKIKIMLAMKSKFMEGGLKNGYSEEALNKLWDTIEEFAKYGFNRSHSVAYAMTAYSSAYLKTHYPVEFMAALLAQNADRKEKLLPFLQEARTMGLKVGATDINSSDIRVAPDFIGQSDFDILYGLGGVKAVSNETAKIIVDERERSGLYKSVQDLINRCSPLGITNKKIYENLALSGAFDSFNVTRRAIIEGLPSMLGEAKTKTNKGASLFDVLGGADNSTLAVDLTSTPEYPFVEKLQKEADVIGLYLTDHPLSKIGSGLSSAGVTKISALLAKNSSVTVNIVGTVTEIEKKITRNGGKSVKITIDDGSGYLQSGVRREIVKGIDKKNAQLKLEQLYKAGEIEVAPELEKMATDRQFVAQDDISANSVYLFSVTFKPSFGDAPYGARVNTIKPLVLADDGSLPIRIRINTKTADPTNPAVIKKLSKFAEAIAAKVPGDYPIMIGAFRQDEAVALVDDAEYYESLIAVMKEEAVTRETTKPVKIKSRKTSGNLFKSGESETESKTDNSYVRELPSKLNDANEVKPLTEVELSEALTYIETGFTAAKNSKIEELLSTKFGGERVDFGIFNKSMLENGD